MHRDEIKDLLERRDVLVETIAAGASERDRVSLDAELSEVRAALASLGRGAATG